MIYGSVCSGIEAATVAWHPLGWQPAWFSEIEPFPCRLLQHYYPHVPNLGDMLKIEHNEHFQRSAIDLLVGGTPCQSFSTAGLRGGLADDRGNLALEFCRILIAKRPRWFVWENVPGVFSSYSYEEGSSRVDSLGRTEGREFTETADFASILSGFQDCGYSCAWRVLDAQFCGVPQRRRRVFVVGYFGDDWRPSAAVLFEPEGMRGHSPKGGKKRQGVAALTKAGVGTCGADDNQAQAGHIIAGTIDASYGRLQGASGQDAGHGHSTLVFGGNNTSGSIDVATAVNASKSGSGRLDFESESFAVTFPYNQITSKENRSNPTPGDPSGTLSKTDSAPLLIGFQSSQSGVRLVEKHATLDANNGARRQNGITDGLTVRRLTPLECERLQGFPDHYTAILEAADSPRYESIGNSMPVPVMRRIGKRIDMVDKIFKLNIL